MFVSSFECSHLRLSNTSVVVWTVEGQTSESSLYVEATLILGTRVTSNDTFINIWVVRGRQKFSNIHLINTNVKEKSVANKVTVTYPGSCARLLPRCSLQQGRSSGSCRECCDSDRNKCDLQWAEHIHQYLERSQKQLE